MQRLEVSGAVRHIYLSLDSKRLITITVQEKNIIKNSVYCVSYTLWLCQHILLQTMQHITYISQESENLHQRKLRTGIYFITANLQLIMPPSLSVRFS
jgi:hypothetical protein